MADEERWWIHDEEGEENSSKRSVEEALNKAETERIQRDKEMEEAQHELELARMGAEKEKLEEEGGQTTNLREEHGGVLGFWWLTPTEAVTIGLSTMLVVFFLGMGTYVAGDEPKWVETEAEILEVAGGWWEINYYEECDDWGCDWWEDIDCFADLDVSHSINGVSYTGEANGYWLYIEEYYNEGEEDECVHYAENVVPLVGTSVTIYYDPGNPSDILLEEPLPNSIMIFFCCIPVFLLLMVATLINARLNNSPKLIPGEHQSNETGGPTVVHHHHHGGWRGPRWGFFWGGTGRHRRHGGGRRTTRRRTRSGGNRRSGGGGRSRGGRGRR